MVSVLHKLPDGSLIVLVGGLHDVKTHIMRQPPFGDDFTVLVDHILLDNAQGHQYGIRDGVDGLPW
jgi:hypothetical protein